MKNTLITVLATLLVIGFTAVLTGSYLEDIIAPSYDVPLTSGQVFYVTPDIGAGSDSYSGRSPDTPFATIQHGIDRCSGKTHDYVVLLPSASSYDDDPLAGATTDDGIRKRLQNACIYINKPYVHLVGQQNKWGEEVYLTPGSAASAGFINVGASGDYCSIENLNVYAAANALVVVASGANYLTVKDCYFRGGTIAIDADAGDASRIKIYGCVFEDQATYGVAMNSSKGQIFDCDFITPGSTSPTAFLYTTGNAPSIVGPNLRMNGNGSATAGYSNNNVAGVMLVNSFIIGCTDNVSIGSGGNTGIVWTISKDGGQGAVQVGYDGVADQTILITG